MMEYASWVNGVGFRDKCVVYGSERWVYGLVCLGMV